MLAKKEGYIEHGKRRSPQVKANRDYGKNASTAMRRTDFALSAYKLLRKPVDDLCKKELTKIAENVLKKQPQENIRGEQPVIDKF